MTYPIVTAIVLNWCDEEGTTECLNSLLKSEYRTLRLLLVDNGSTDNSFVGLKASFPEIEVLQTGKNLGYAGGNNRGMERALRADPDYVLILNNDTVIDPHAIGKMVELAEKAEGRVGGVVPKILYYHDPERIWYGGGEFSALKGLGIHWQEGHMDQSDRVEEAHLVTFMTGACCLLSVEVVRELKGFDESFFAYVEDADLSLRMTQAGYQMYYHPEARILHRSPPPGSPPSPFQIRQRDRNRRRIMRKHGSISERPIFLLRFFVSRIILLVKYSLTRDWERARAILNGMGFG